MSIALSLVVLGSLAAAQEPQERSEPVEVLRTWSGGRTAIRTPEVQRVTAADEWAKLWERHVGNRRERAPEVDFEKQMVIAVFLGDGRWETVDVHAVKKTKAEIVFGVEVQEQDCCDMSVHPVFVMAVVPRSPMKVAVIGRVRKDVWIDPKKDRILRELPALQE